MGGSVVSSTVDSGGGFVSDAVGCGCVVISSPVDGAVGCIGISSPVDGVVGSVVGWVGAVVSGGTW